MKVVKAPGNVSFSELCVSTSIFLAGSIDMGAATNWQQEFEKQFQIYDSLILLNPRRDDWNSSWIQDIANEKFREQVEWELGFINDADLVIFYFDPNGPAPITLMELGLRAAQKAPCIVCCPPGYWRRGNVQVLCKNYKIPLVDSLENLIKSTKGWLQENAKRTR